MSSDIVRQAEHREDSAGVRHLHEKAHEGANQCIQCGYCLPACPTYASMGRESASPRGRINLVKAAAEGKIDVLEDMAMPLDLCLGCRACEVACPVGVPYGKIFEAAKVAIVEEGETRKQGHGTFGQSSASGRTSKRIQALLLRRLFPSPGRLRIAGNLTWAAQISGVQRLAVKTGAVKTFYPALGAMAEILPKMDPPWRRLKPGSVLPAIGEKKLRVGFFQGCVMDAVLFRMNRLSVELLRRLGCEVIVAEDQRCCGALHMHQGFETEARALAKANVAAFEKTEADFYVNNAGGCGAMLHEYPHLFEREPEWRERAEQFASRSRDITQVLAQLGPLTVANPVEGFVTYQDSCHLRNVQKVSQPPRDLLRQVAGERFVELPGASECCASGGIYNLIHFEESMKILDNKMKKVEAAAATTVVTTNPGCQLQMALGIRRAGLQDRIRSCHLVEVLAECMGIK